MKKPVLRIALYRDGSVVRLKILEQDYKVIKRGNFSLDQSEITVKSVSHPQLSGDILYLRGVDTNQDLNSFSYHYGNDDRAKSRVEAIIKVVELINEKYSK